MKTRGELLKSRREALGFTQQDVATRLHITQQSYHAIETDVVVNPRRTTLKGLAKMLDIPYETLLLGPGWQDEVSEQGRVVGQMYDKLPREEQQQILFMLLQAKARALAHDDPTSERNLL